MTAAMARSLVRDTRRDPRRQLQPLPELGEGGKSARFRGVGDAEQNGHEYEEDEEYEFTRKSAKPG